MEQGTPVAQSREPYTTRTVCRVCSAPDLQHIGSLGELYVSNFIRPGDRVVKAPLELVLCTNCSLLQLKHTAPQELLYSRFYWYKSGITETMRKALQEVAGTVTAMAKLKAGDVVLDIGANDGTLLGSFMKGIVRIGCEPADNLIGELKKNCEHALHDFWSYDAYTKARLPKAKVITALGMFYDMEDPNQFVADAAKALADDGIFVAQLMCLKNMLEQNDVGNICHEHLEYYSLESLKFLFEKNGLEIFTIEENNVNGGSYRLYARHLRKGSIPFDEKFTKEDYLAFFRRIGENKRKCVEFITREVAKGKKVYAYGASTKGNTILQYYGLTPPLIAGAADKSDFKWGRFTVGTMIPIVSEEEARPKADYFFVLPYAFLDEFLKREEAWRAKGGKFIVPLPEFRVI